MDKLYEFINKEQGDEAWGAVLDAGTKPSSLEWVLSLPTESWTGVAADEDLIHQLRESFSNKMRPDDRLIYGVWQDEMFLENNKFDVILVDYLMAELDSYAPHFQDHLFARLRPLVKKHLYFVGMEPYPQWTENTWGQSVLDLRHMLDAIVLLAGFRPRREYPMAWSVRHLEAAGYTIVAKERFPIIYGANFIDQMFDEMMFYIQYLKDRNLAESLSLAAEKLKNKAHKIHDINPSASFGEDYVIHAIPKKRREWFL